MINQINSHVERMHNYLPFDPSHDQIYEEYQESKDSLELTTQALLYLRDILESDPPSAIILTGDAGHGKTHLCRRLIQDYLKYDDKEARKLLAGSCQGAKPIPFCKDVNFRKPLRIFKDFSEFPVEVAADYLERALDDENDITLVCVNEGRLRAILETDSGPHSIKFKNDFHSSFESGLASSDGKNHIINLNYQSVASEKNSLVKRALREWLKGTRWRVCKKCDSSSICPIFKNRKMLVDEAERQNRIEVIYSTIERLGTVITIRELLMSLAYLLTGNLRCTDVHRNVRKKGWQNEYAYYSLMFSSPRNISSDRIRRIQVLAAFKKLDPGKHAIRTIDDVLINFQNIFPPSEIDLCFKGKIDKSEIIIDAGNGIDEIIGNARSRKERTHESILIQNVVRSLRRRYLFDRPNGEKTSFRNLGFEYAHEFLWLVSNKIDHARKTRIKSILIGGFHTIQGLNVGSDTTRLFLVDPAYGKTTNRAAIIAYKFPSNKISILTQTENWKVSEEGEKYTIPYSVDWLDREVVLNFNLPDGDSEYFHLNLMTFDYLMQAGSGYVAQEFYAHDIRKALNFLGRLAEKCSVVSESSIEAVIEGYTHNVLIEEGNVIQSNKKGM